MSQTRSFILSTIILAMFATPALAQESQETHKAQDAQRCPFSATLEKENITYPEKAGNTFLRGALNAGFGWTELILYPAHAAREKEGNVLSNMAIAAGQGVGRTLSGLGEILTFWTPRVNGDYLLFSNDSPLDMYNDSPRNPQESPTP